MIYNFNTHSLDYTAKVIPTFSLALNTIELEYILQSGKLVDVTGFLPLIKSEKTKINIGKYSSSSFFFEDSLAEANDVFDIFDKIPEIKKYFIPQTIKFDEDKGIIQVGTDLELEDKILKVNDSIFYGVDLDGFLKCLYLIPEKFIS